MQILQVVSFYYNPNSVLVLIVVLVFQPRPWYIFYTYLDYFNLLHFMLHKNSISRISYFVFCILLFCYLLLEFAAALSRFVFRILFSFNFRQLHKSFPKKRSNEVCVKCFGQ